MPKIQLPKKIERILTTPARIVVIVGGRSSAKSESIARLLLMKAQTEGADVLCGREYQNTIDDSVHKLLKNLIQKVLKVEGFEVTDKKIHGEGEIGDFRFKGFNRNPENVKSAQDFKYSWIEEAQSISEKTIEDLLPTIRATGSKLFFTANPQSSADPFSKRFINPFLRELLADGYYEDEMHLVIMANWRDNPWHDELEAQRLWDKKNYPLAKYRHIWEGDFNDSIENALVLAEWFDACVDSHIKLGFDPVGKKLAAHDPSDTGPDAKGYAMRHGSVVLDIQEKTTGDVNEGGDWATGLALKQNVDAYTWDCDGLGVGLNRQTSEVFEGKHTEVTMFKGSESVDDPDKIYDPVEKGEVHDQKTNKQVFKNKRAQFAFMLRDRIHRTYQAVTLGKYIDPDELISFSSELKHLGGFRSEVCRMPIKPNGNGLCELYTKQEMKSKFKMDSPNMFDSVMMLMRNKQTSKWAKLDYPQTAVV